MNELQSGQHFLRTALMCNAGFSVLSATTIIFCPDSLVRCLAIPRDFGVLLLGIGLIVFAIRLLLNAAQPQITLVGARLAVAVDLTWVATSILVIVLAPLALQGKLVVAIIAVIVLCFALAQWIGLRRMRSASVEELPHP